MILPILYVTFLYVTHSLYDNTLNFSTFLDVQFLNTTEDVRLSQNLNHKYEAIHWEEV